MRSFSNKRINKSLKKSINKMTSKQLSQINNLEIKENLKMKKNKKLLPIFAPTFAILIILTGFSTIYYNKNLKVNSNITLDVNPSIILSTNYYNKVIKAKALNNDGKEILENIKVNNLSAENATNILIDELINKGYLEGSGANILLTVQNNDLSKAKELETVLSKTANEKLDKEYIAGTVLTQADTIKKNIRENIKELMDKYDISYSKAVFINNILQKNETLVTPEIAKLRINEISKLINEKKLNIGDSVKHNNEDSLYENFELTQLRKNKEQAEKNKLQAEKKEKTAIKNLNKDNNNNIKKAQEKYEEAKKEKERAEQKAEDTRKAYELAKETQNQQQSAKKTNNQQNYSLSQTNTSFEDYNTNETFQNRIGSSKTDSKNGK